MLKQHIIHQYISGEEIVAIIPQHHGRSLGLMLQYGGIALGVYVVYMILGMVLGGSYIVGLVSSLLLIIVFLVFNYQFMILYLDSIVITSTGIIMMDQIGLLDFTQTKFDRDTIQTLSYHQYGAIDRLLNKGDITIGIEHGSEYQLPNVIQPQKWVDRINTYKHDYILARARELALAQEELSGSSQNSKFDLLVDKLSDIIVDYMHQPRQEQAIVDSDLHDDEAYEGYYDHLSGDKPTT